MMEVLGAPQTHLGLKAMIQEVDEDRDGRISFREVSTLYSCVHISNSDTPTLNRDSTWMLYNGKCFIRVTFKAQPSC